MTPLKSGAVPIGVLIHANQSTENYQKGLEELKIMWCKYNIDIECFVTDDSKSLKGALNNVWPEVIQLLCQYHVAAAVWNWLFVPAHKVSALERVKCIKHFRLIMYAPSKVLCEQAFRDAILLFADLQQFVKYLTEYFTRKKEWCFSYRMNVLNRSHNTNNLAETNFRLLKDTILGRLKAPNSIALLSYICFEFDEYYSRRLTDVAFGRGMTKNKLYQQVAAKAKLLIDNQSAIFQRLDDDVFSVPASDAKSTYIVHITLGTCSCVDGCQGKFCKHQCAVGILYDKEFMNSPILSANDKADLFYVANASRLERDFFLPLKPIAPENRPENQAHQEHDKENMCPPCSSESESISDWDDFDEPPRKRAKLDEDVEVSQVLKHFDVFTAKARDIISKSSSDSFLMKHVSRFAKYGSKFETGTQIAAFFSTALERHGRGGKKIQVQPMNIARRKSSSRSRRVLRSGRPLGGVKVVAKRKRDLALNISQNQRNAKSHGNAH